MKKIYYILILLVLFSYSCEDVLDKAPLDIISEDVVFDDPALTEAYINNLYSDLWFLDRESPKWDVDDPLSMLSDEARQSWAWEETHFFMKAGLMDQNNQYGVLNLWPYGTIRKANEFLVKMQESSLSDNVRNDMIARVKFARAITYFYMVKRYGGIPLITEPQAIDAPEDELFLPRNTELEVYDFIVNEMDVIANDLPATRGNRAFPSKYAALALKSRAAMYAASIATWGEVKLGGVVGIPATEAQRFWQDCYDASKAVIESEKFALYNQIPDNKTENYRKLFVDENNSEVIFSRQLTGTSQATANSIDLFHGPGQTSAWAGGCIAVYLEMVEEYENIDGTPGTFDEALATSQLWDLTDFFANKDPRFNASVFYEGTIWKGVTIEHWTGVLTADGTKITTGFYEGIRATGRSTFTAGSAGGQITGFGVKKYLDENLADASHFKSKIDFIVFRLGEMYLNMAEAAFELGKTGEALAAVNTIRNRAGMPALTEITRDKIRHERKIELAFEGHRYWDLRRMRIAEDALTRNFRGIYTYKDSSTGKFKIEINNDAQGGIPSVFRGQHYYLPITPGRIVNNPKLVENPLY